MSLVNWLVRSRGRTGRTGQTRGTTDNAASADIKTMGDLRVRQRGLAELARCSRTSQTCRTGQTRGTPDNAASADIKTMGGKRAVTTAVRRDQQRPCLSCRRRDKRLSPASRLESGALSHSRAAANVPLRSVAPFPLVGLDRPAPAKRERSVNKKKFRHSATRFCTVMRGDFEFCKERYEGSVFAKATPGQGVLTRLLVTA